MTDQSETAELNYDLSMIEASDLPPVNKLAMLQNEVEKDENTTLELQNDSELMMQLQKEIIPLGKTGEIEITSIPKRNGKYSHRGRPHRTPSYPNPDGSHSCSQCDKKFQDVGQLLLHKSVHGDDFICNFCNMSFKSLQFLRRHNSMCSKGMQIFSFNSMLSFSKLSLPIICVNNKNLHICITLKIKLGKVT